MLHRASPDTRYPCLEPGFHQRAADVDLILNRRQSIRFLSPMQPYSDPLMPHRRSPPLAGLVVSRFRLGEALVKDLGVLVLDHL